MQPSLSQQTITADLCSRSYIHRERVVWSCWLHGHPDIWHFSLHLRGLELRFHKFDNSKSKWLFLTPYEEFWHTESCDIKNSTWVFWYQPSPQPSGIHISPRPSDSGWYGCPRAETRADIKIPMCYYIYITWYIEIALDIEFNDWADISIRRLI